MSVIEAFLKTTKIENDWNLEPLIWREAGIGFQIYATARKKQQSPEPRRILADFLIGAHAQERGLTLLTLDSRVYATSFPKLRIETLQ